MENTNSITEKVWPVALAAAEQNGCILYDLEFVGGGNGRTLRVFIDRVGGNVSVGDCEAVSRTLNLHLDQGDMIPGEGYYLEVSSPGLDRTLKRPEHFRSAIGSEVQLRLKAPLTSENSQRQYSGKVVSADADGIEMEIGGSETGTGTPIKFPYSNIEKGKMVFNFGPNPKNKKEKKK